MDKLLDYTTMVDFFEKPIEEQQEYILNETLKQFGFRNTKALIYVKKYKLISQENKDFLIKYKLFIEKVYPFTIKIKDNTDQYPLCFLRKIMKYHGFKLINKGYRLDNGKLTSKYQIQPRLEPF